MKGGEASMSKCKAVLDSQKVTKITVRGKKDLKPKEKTVPKKK